MKKLLMAALLVIAFPGQAAVMSAIGVINKMVAYDSFGQGDVVITFPTAVTNCENGVYISPASPGAGNMLNMALAAYMAQVNVSFQVEDTQPWPGGATNYCKARTVELQ